MTKMKLRGLKRAVSVTLERGLCKKSWSGYLQPTSLVVEYRNVSITELPTVSTMFEMFFGSCTLTIAVINAIIAFAAYFFTFYISSMIMNFISPGDTQDAKNRLDNLIIFALEYLVLINIVSNMLPSHFTILEFLKLYVAFILFRGLDYINYKEKPVFFVTVATLSVLIIPVAINYVLGLIIPVAN